MWYPALFARAALTCLPALLTLPVAAQSVELNFSSLGTSLITFDSTQSTLSFTSDATTPYEFEIGSSNEPGLVGYKGNLTGTFGIGAVTTLGSGAFQVEEAPVTGTGYLTISDGTSTTFSAEVKWDSILTVGGSGALNAGDVVNLSNFSYGGTNPVLQALAADGSGTAEVSFQFVPSQGLAELASGAGGASTSYSGSFEAIPEPGAYAVLAGAFAFIGTIVWKSSQPRRAVVLP